MPITLRPNQIKYKTSEGYQTLDVVTDETLESKIAKINAAGDQKTSAIQTLGDQKLAGIQTTGDQKLTNIQTTGNEKVSSIETKGSQYVTEITNLSTAALAQMNKVVASIPADYTALSKEVDQVRDDMSDLPMFVTGEEWANKEELSTELLLQALNEIDRMFSTGLPQESTMGRAIVELTKGNGLLNDLYIGMEAS